MVRKLRKIAPAAALVAGGLALAGAAWALRRANRVDFDFGWDDLPV